MESLFLERIHVDKHEAKLTFSSARHVDIKVVLEGGCLKRVLKLEALVVLRRRREALCPL